MFIWKIGFLAETQHYVMEVLIYAVNAIMENKFCISVLFYKIHNNLNFWDKTTRDLSEKRKGERDSSHVIGYECYIIWDIPTWMSFKLFCL